MEVLSLLDLENLESHIAKKLQKHKLGDVLHSLYSLNGNQTLEPFMIAGLTLLAARFCIPSKSSQLIRYFDVRSLIDLSNNYYLSDPTIFDNTLSPKQRDNSEKDRINQGDFLHDIISLFYLTCLALHYLPLLPSRAQ